MPARSVAPATVAGVVTVLAITALGWRLQLAQQLPQLETDVQKLRQELIALNAAPTAEHAAHLDFVQRLPMASDIDPIVSQFQRSGAALGVSFVSVSVSAREPAQQAMGRTQLNVTLRGTYPNVKTVLAETFDRYPELLLERLTMRRLASPVEVEARVDGLLVTRPQSAAASVSPATDR